MRDRSVRLCLESLEERCVLATTRLLGSNLFITADNAGGPITLTATADNTFRVNVPGTSLGTFQVAGNIFLFGSNAPDTFVVNLGSNTYTGNLFIFTRDGNDAININGSGRIAGNVTLLTGNGNDGITVATNIGGTLTVHNQNGRNTFNFGTGSSILGGDLTVTGAAAINLGAGADIIDGSVNVNSILVNTGVTVTTAPGLQIDKNLFITTGNGTNLISFNSGNFEGLVSLTLGQLGAGSNTIFNAGPLNIAGDFDVNTGSGPTSITLATGTNIFGSALLNLGNGVNNLTGLTNSFVVNGNLELFLGNGNNAPFTLGGTVAGQADLHLGNGNNNVTIAVNLNGNLNWTSGNGNDTLTLAYGPTNPLYMVNVRFGNGDDVFATTGVGELSGMVDGGGRLFGNKFLPGDGTVIVPSWTLSNFP